MSAKRKINVEKLTDEQLKIAEKNISTKINSEIDKLIKKWQPEVLKLNRELKIAITISESQKEQPTVIKQELDLSEFDENLELKQLVENFNKISKYMDKDLESTVNSCNLLLNRYNLSCNMSYNYQVITN
jgi:hypothetical protein